MINIRDSFKENFNNYSLFCINTGSFNYSNATFMVSKIVMQSLFPIPTPYEIIDYDLSLLSYETIVLLMKKIPIIKNRNNIYIKQIENKINLILFLISFSFFIAFFFFKIIIYLKQYYINFVNDYL